MLYPVNNDKHETASQDDDGETFSHDETDEDDEHEIAPDYERVRVYYTLYIIYYVLTNRQEFYCRNLFQTIKTTGTTNWELAEDA